MRFGDSLAAVIVTYNRLDKLRKVIAALQAQTRTPDRIFVVDNASDDGTGEWLQGLEEPRLQHVRLPENIGGAGGFHEGVRIAYEDGYDLIWISDDDAYPEPDAVEKLVGALNGFEAATGRWAPFACSMIRWTDGGLCEMNTPATVWDWPRFYRPETPWFMVGSCSFVSMLAPRWAVAEHGLPIKEYFIWYDDAEYTQRLARSHPGLFVPDSVVIHDIPDNKGVNYSLVTDATLWKFRYGARNETSCRLRDQGWWGVIEFVRQVRHQSRRLPLRLRLALAKAIWAGLFFRPEIVKPKG